MQGRRDAPTSAICMGRKLTGYVVIRESPILLRSQLYSPRARNNASSRSLQTTVQCDVLPLRDQPHKRTTLSGNRLAARAKSPRASPEGFLPHFLRIRRAIPLVSRSVLRTFNQHVQGYMADSGRARLVACSIGLFANNIARSTDQPKAARQPPQKLTGTSAAFA